MPRAKSEHYVDNKKLFAEMKQYLDGYLLLSRAHPRLSPYGISVMHVMRSIELHIKKTHTRSEMQNTFALYEDRDICRLLLRYRGP